MAKATIGLIAIVLAGLSAGYWLGGFAVGGGAYHVYHGYHMAEAGAADQAADADTQRLQLDQVAAGVID